MKVASFVITVALLGGCEKRIQDMKLPNGWEAGEYVSGDEHYGEPPISKDESKILFYGCIEGDLKHRLFSVPATTSVSEIVEVFEVGSHGAQSYGFEAKETVALVAQKATEITKIVESRVVFADAAGLKLKFKRPINQSDLEKIEILFPEEEVMQAGLEGYLSGWSGEGSILAEVLEENTFHFWWD